jgi:hypothetical protein
MKRLFALYVAVILTAASTCYANMAGMYNYDRYNLPSWKAGSYIRFKLGDFVNANVHSFHLSGGYIDQVALIAPAGCYLTPTNVQAFLNTTNDGSGWIYRSGNYWVSGSGRMDAVLTWASGVHLINVRYVNVNNRPAKPKARAKTQRRELLPPVQES